MQYESNNRRCNDEFINIDVHPSAGEIMEKFEATCGHNQGLLYPSDKILWINIFFDKIIL